jgi:redox-sensitive bicupin YhaK (pirin superfamily)
MSQTKIRSIKKIFEVSRSTTPHWVGDGFPVRTVLSVREHGDRISPFAMLDFAGPAEFEPSDKPRGVDQHPHKGFETVTLVYQGELEHRDSAGNSGMIGPGDVQWMTAGSGVVHEEKHSRAFTKAGGAFEVAQLWVNLPAKDKKEAPSYQELPSRSIPVATLPDGQGSVRVVAGQFEGLKGPARTHTKLNVWDVNLAEGAELDLSGLEGQNTVLYFVKGSAKVNGEETVDETELAILEREGDGLRVEAQVDTQILFLSGEPIDEPVVAHGPFVMNTYDEIVQAVREYQSGKMGALK